MSRATVDLQAVRFFLGYGLVFIAQSALTIVLRRGRDVRHRPRLASIALSPVPFVIWIAHALRAPLAAGAAGGPAAHRRADRRRRGERRRRARRQGVRARGAPARALPAPASSRVFDQSMISTRLRAFYSPFIGFLPQLGLAAIAVPRRPRGHRRRAGRSASSPPSTSTCSTLLGPMRDARHDRSGWPSARPRRARGSSRCSTASRRSSAAPGAVAAAAGLRAASSCAT